MNQVNGNLDLNLGAVFSDSSQTFKFVQVSYTRSLLTLFTINE